MLNLGCGSRFHPAWVNADIAPQHEDVVRWDVSQGVPFPDQHFDVVYHSHMIEHLRRAEVPAFLKECARVLKPVGILRVATPDLERICALYLEKLRTSAEADQEWLTIELLDQAVREHSGGEMLEYLRLNPLPNEPFVLERIGEEGRELLAAIRDTVRQRASPAAPVGAGRLVAGLQRQAQRLRDAMVTRWYGDEALRAMRIGHFRLRGEVHQWLYDRVSLRRTLLTAGFGEPTVAAAGESAIPGWRRFGLEVTDSGQVIKPDSLFMEARKPA
jgi:SAM-dependent methyltransferase